MDEWIRIHLQDVIDVVECYHSAYSTEHRKLLITFVDWIVDTGESRKYNAATAKRLDPKGGRTTPSRGRYSVARSAISVLKFVRNQRSCHLGPTDERENGDQGLDSFVRDTTTIASGIRMKTDEVHISSSRQQ